MTVPVKFRLVTLAEAKDQLSIVGDEDDKRIDRLVLDASQAIMNYLKISPALDGWTDTAGIPLVDANGDPLRIGAVGGLNTAGVFVYTYAEYDTAGNGIGDPIDVGISIVPGPVRLATFVAIAALDDDREGAKDPITPAVVSLLERMRDPAMA